MAPQEQSNIESRLPSLRKPTETVTFYCGQDPEAEPFIVHKEFAVHYSDALKAAFASLFIEGQTQTYRFEDTSTEAIRLLIYWMYTQHLDVVPLTELEAWVDGSPPQKRLIESQQHSLCELWVLADKMLIPRLQNHVLEQINEVAIQTCWTPIDSINYVWENTDEDSKLRRWFLRRCERHVSHSNFDDVNDKRFPQDTLHQLVKALFQSQIAESKPSPVISEYYVADPEDKE